MAGPTTEIQLGEGSPHELPRSLEVIIDFVCEHVTSNILKYISNEIVTPTRLRAIKEFHQSCDGKIPSTQRHADRDESPEDWPDESENLAEETAEDARVALAWRFVKEAKRECAQKLPEMCRMKTMKSLNSLLSHDTPSSVRETCLLIAKQRLSKSIMDWIDDHIYYESPFLEDMKHELNELKICDRGDRISNEIRKNSEDANAVEVTEMLQNMMWEFMEERENPTMSEESIIENLQRLRKSLLQCTESSNNAEKTFYPLSVEYCSLLITYKCYLFTTEVRELFFDIWKINKSRDRAYAKIITPRNIRWVTSSSNPEVMQLFGDLLKKLLQDNLLNVEALGEQCVALLREDWPEVNTESVLKQVSHCLMRVVEDCKCSGSDDEKIKYLIGWIAMACDEMNVSEYD